jgi:hypothetical protein
VRLFASAAAQIDKILKGANPAEIPIYQATKFELDGPGAQSDDTSLIVRHR